MGREGGATEDELEEEQQEVQREEGEAAAGEREGTDEDRGERGDWEEDAEDDIMAKRATRMISDSGHGIRFGSKRPLGSEEDEED